MDSLSTLTGLLTTVISFAAIITLLVGVHELGHFFFARLFKMDVEAFAIMVGGVRETNLMPLRPNKIASPWMVAGIYVAVVVASFIATMTKSQPILIGSLAVLAAPLPVWIALRVGYLYGKNASESLKSLGYSYLGAAAILFLATRFQNLKIDQVLTLAILASIVGLIIAYYAPLGLKTEDDERMGLGMVHLGSETIEVRYRPVWRIAKKNGTEYSLLLLPLGGFVRIKGMHPKEDGSEYSIENGFYSKPAYQRFLTLFAGPIFSLLLGSMLLFTAFATFGQSKAIDKPILGGVTKDGVAHKAGLKAGDRVVSLDGVPMDSFFQLVSYVRDRGGKSIEFVAERKGSQITGSVIPALDKEPTPIMGSDLEFTEEMKVQAKIGVAPDISVQRVTLEKAFTDAVKAPILAAQNMVGMFSNLNKAKEGLGGPATIATATHNAAQEGMYSLLVLAGLLSISLGYMNLLSIPPLDGGQMMVALYEMVLGGKRMSRKLQGLVTNFGVLLVLLLMALAWTQDVSRFMGK